MLNLKEETNILSVRKILGEETPDYLKKVASWNNSEWRNNPSTVFMKAASAIFEKNKEQLQECLDVAINYNIVGDLKKLASKLDDRKPPFDVKKASDEFEQEYLDYNPVDRIKYASYLYNKGSESDLVRCFGDRDLYRTYNNTKLAFVVNRRADRVKDLEGKAQYEKIAQTLKSVQLNATGMMKIASMVEFLDRKYHIYPYNEHIKSPMEEFLKCANESPVKTYKLNTKEYSKECLENIPMEVYKEALGEDIEFTLDILPTLTRPDRVTLEKLIECYLSKAVEHVSIK